MPYAFVAVGVGAGNDTFSTAAINSTGANLLVACWTDALIDPVLSDSYGNTWTLARSYKAWTFSSKIYYSYGTPTVGAGHTMTITGTDFYGSGQLWAFSGADTANPLDQSNESGAAGVTTLQPGSVTPTTAGQLVMTHVAYDAGTLATINGGFASPGSGSAGSSGVYGGSASSYLIQTTAAAANPTWTWTNGANASATIATFKAGGGGGGATSYPYRRTTPNLTYR
jgi:hypothetical protein